MSDAILLELTRSNYTAPNRFFHNLDHIAACLAELEDAMRNAVAIQDPEAVRFAIWFHDVVYDGTRPDNEELSAEAAYEAAGRLGRNVDFAAKVKRLVLVTKHSSLYPPVEPDEELICDIDLSSLAADDFAGNTALIRREYAHVPDELFSSSRKRILAAFLEMPFVYRTAFFRRKYEAKARENLRRATSGLV
jgi:predicted metal-dependent HD superfamily phosphohydrolase